MNYYYARLPEHLRGGMKRYLEDRIEPGSFLRAALENDLVGAFARADAISTRSMPDIAAFLYTELPSREYGLAWGSPEAVSNWLARKDQQSGDKD